MLKVQHLSKSYRTGNSDYPVLKDLSLEVNKGEFVAVMGPSGSGKTTLLNCISCFIPYEEGNILLGNESISHLSEDKLAWIRNQKLGFVFQDFMLLDGLSVFENICLPKMIGSSYTKSAESTPTSSGLSLDAINAMEARAKELCHLFGIENIMDKYPSDISGGEKQRTAVARALMNQPYLILADEPTGNLDSRSSRAVIDAFLQAQSSMQATVFMVTHDSFAASFCNRVIVLRDGSIYKQLVRTGSRQAFMDILLKTFGEMGCQEEEINHE